MDGFKARQRASELQVMRSCLLTSMDDSSSCPSTTVETRQESMSIEWTDEKHSLYLKSMEASFVNDLYDSMELLGWCPEKMDVSLSKTSKQTLPNPSSPPRQFEVLRSGCCRRIHFNNAAESRAANETNEIGSDLLSNPWILHFKSPPVEPRASMAHTASAGRENDNSDWKKAVSRWGASSSKQFRLSRSNLCRQDLHCNKTEVSDQNFVDEDNGGGNVKRVKTQELDHCSARDQVVPLRKT